MTIDVHTHVTPRDIPQAGSRDPLWPVLKSVDEDTATLVIGGRPFRQIEARTWDARRRLADMAGQGVQVQILSPMPELLSFWLPASDAAFLAYHMNDHIASMIAVAPGRFGGLGMVAMQDIPTAIGQLGDVARLGLSGIEIGTHINGVPLGDPSLWPLYEAAEARGLAIFVHPLHPCGIDRIGGEASVGMLATFPIEIALAAVSLIAAGVPQRFPGLRILLSHGGGALPTMLGRLDQGRRLSPAIGAALAEDALTSARRFWFDSNVYDPEALRFLASRIGSDRLVIGSDYPFLIQQDQPIEFVERALPGATAQCACNAAAFLGGADLLSRSPIS